MAVNVKPVEQLEFRGIYVSGNPVQRPRNTADECVNFRVMPGNFLRLRSGRRPFVYLGATEAARGLHSFRAVDKPGSDYQFLQTLRSTVDPGDTLARWLWLNLGAHPSVDASKSEHIFTDSDGGFALTNPAAACNINDRPVVYNGLGVRSLGSGSQPPFSMYTSAGWRYFGLDCYVAGVSMTPARQVRRGLARRTRVPSGPTITATAPVIPGTGIITNVDIAVGLWHKPTNHFGNGVLAGSTGPTGGDTIKVQNLDTLRYGTHGAAETSELYYVFYATIDGGQIRYMIMNATLDGPLAVPVQVSGVQTTEATLSIDATADNGWNLDLTSEMPTLNFPPRPMRSIAYVNGRLYGVLMNGGSQPNNAGTDFSYTPLPRELIGVCWSAASSDATSGNFVGDPLQSWPFWNLEYTPSAEQPLFVTQASDGRSVLVVTATSTFLLEETADGLHEWTTVSRNYGVLAGVNTLRTTPYGTVWVTQRKEIVLLPPGSLQIQVLSREYQDYMMMANPTAADYVSDPTNLVDRYQVWFDNGYSLSHDFLLPAPGVAYMALLDTVTMAATAIGADGLVYRLIGNSGLYTHEADPIPAAYLFSGTPLMDATYQSDGSVVYADFSAKWIRNYDDFGDADVRKELPMVDLIGDVCDTDGTKRLSLSWWGDFESQTNPAHTTVAIPVPQSVTNRTYRYQLAAGSRFWYKVSIVLQGKGQVWGGSTGSYPALAGEGNSPNNFYGMVLRALWRVGTSENRG